MSYKELRVEAIRNDKAFRVQVKGWFNIWKSGYVYTDYFAISYTTKHEALHAIHRYKNRYTHTP